MTITTARLAAKALFGSGILAKQPDGPQSFVGDVLNTSLVYVIFLTLVDGFLLFELYTLSLFVELLPMEILFLTQMRRFGNLVL